MFHRPLYFIAHGIVFTVLMSQYFFYFILSYFCFCFTLSFYFYINYISAIFLDPLRSDVREAVSTAQKAGVTVRMVTGTYVRDTIRNSDLLSV